MTLVTRSFLPRSAEPPRRPGSVAPRRPPRRWRRVRRGLRWARRRAGHAGAGEPSGAPPGRCGKRESTKMGIIQPTSPESLALELKEVEESGGMPWNDLSFIEFLHVGGQQIWGYEEIKDALVSGKGLFSVTEGPKCLEHGRHFGLQCLSRKTTPSGSP